MEQLLAWVEASLVQMFQYNSVVDASRHSPLSRHFRIVLSRLALTSHGSTRVLPSSPTVRRIHNLKSVTLCQCASTSPISSGSSGVDTSYVRMTSPAAVNKYGSARSVSARGRMALTPPGWVIAGGGLVFLSSTSASGTSCTVSSVDASRDLQKRFGRRDDGRTCPHVFRCDM